MKAPKCNRCKFRTNRVVPCDCGCGEELCEGCWKARTDQMRLVNNPDLRAH